MAVALENGLNYNEVDNTIIARQYGISPSESNPEIAFSTAMPVNGKSIAINGYEFSIFHFIDNIGLGVNANYTFMESDSEFDELSLNHQQSPFYLADLANVSILFDKFGFKARIDYSWHDKYLFGRSVHYQEPIYMEDYNQINASVGFNITENLLVFAEGINLGEDYKRSVARSTQQLWSIQENRARYRAGVHYKL